MKKYIIIIFLFTRLFAISGYLYQHDVSDCQDFCSQYYIEPEIDGGFGALPIIFENPNINIDLYINRFVTVDLGQEVMCVECSAFEVSEINISQDCEFPVACFVDPCMVEECQINTPVDCISNYCDGCYADFYNFEGNLVDCNSSINDCMDLSGIPFFECGIEIGFGYTNGECQTMYCSPIDGYGVDWSNWIYNTIEECEEVCGTINSITLGDINFDDNINVLDVVLLVSFILGNPTNEYEYMAADINGDSSIDVLDAILLIEMILNPQLPNECYIVPEVGPCDGICPTYYYNQNTNECEGFITGCCGVEAFNTLQECQNTCE